MRCYSQTNSESSVVCPGRERSPCTVPAKLLEPGNRGEETCNSPPPLRIRHIRLAQVESTRPVSRTTSSTRLQTIGERTVAGSSTAVDTVHGHVRVSKCELKADPPGAQPSRWLLSRSRRRSTTRSGRQTTGLVSRRCSSSLTR